MWGEIKHLWDLAYAEIKKSWKEIVPECQDLWQDIVMDTKALIVDIYNFLKNTIFNAVSTIFTIVSAPLKTTWSVLVDVILKSILVLFKYLWQWLISLF